MAVGVGVRVLRLSMTRLALPSLTGSEPGGTSSTLRFGENLGAQAVGDLVLQRDQVLDLAVEAGSASSTLTVISSRPSSWIT